MKSVFHKYADHVVIIAEIGVNHNGCITTAKKLIKGAADAGADIIKFQYFEPSRLVIEGASCAQYQQQNTSIQNQLDLLKPLTLDLKSLSECKELVESLGLTFMVTAFDEQSVSELKQIGVSHFKIGSGDITDRSLLETLAKLADTVIISSGMSNLDDIRRALSWLDVPSRINPVCQGILQCNSAYPSPANDMNLRVIATLRQQFCLPIGLSDHSLGFHMALAAIGLGASFIEKHVTLDTNMDGPDHSSSMSLRSFEHLVSCVRSVEHGLGSDTKFVTASEMANVHLVRKGIYARKKIVKGQLISRDDIAILRPEGRSSASRIHEFLGKVAKKTFEKGDEIF